MVYEFNDPALRSGLWRDITIIANQVLGAWEIMGDFNSILNQEDRVGSKVSYVKIKEFKECVEQCGLKELKSSGCFYTWSNKQDGPDRVLNRIDRVNKLPAYEVHYDHSPVMIKWEGTGTPNIRIFRYYNMWSMDNSYMTRVEGSWRQLTKGTSMFKVVGKLNRLKKVMLKLNKDKFAEVEKQEDESMKKLVECQEKIQKGPRNELLFKEEKELTKKYIYWKEAKINYLQQKRETVPSTYAVADAFSEFYARLLGTDRQSRDHVEVKEALWDIEGTKAPDPDGYGSQFFKDTWTIVGGDVTVAVLEFFQSGKMLKALNSTMITLIPKTSHATTVEDYRPTTCYPVLDDPRAFWRLIVKIGSLKFFEVF
ncbi:PREDICTED: uncharacterized protein LOC109241456 [Nicotiana attenuata]|uniref:uncharacterized protein LOC109241456 n=1 Tax=Nicotiana attenuata TaxID=49451 RepID=UPI000904AFA9|nr:PREDICTED: uncharacterized protein LOC109241456 [Nicotiana attenuata]